MENLFMGHNAPLSEARACILPVPYEGTACFGKGASMGPAGILYGSREVEEYDMELGFEIIGEKFPEGFHVMKPVDGDPKRKPEEVIADVEKEISKVLDAGKFPIMLGGEHSISVGAVYAMLKKYGEREVSVLQIDAHADLRDEFMGSRFSHACPMRRIRERVKECAQVGIRSMSRECAEYAKAHGGVFGTEFEDREVLDRLGENVYITIDLDGFDPSGMPAVGTPCPGGLSWEKGVGLLREVAKHKNIIGFDTVELAPVKGQVVGEVFAASLVYKLAGYSLFPGSL